MLARATSPAQDTDSTTFVPQQPSRKRKRGPAHAAASPAPSDVGSAVGAAPGGTTTTTTTTTTTDLLPTSRADLSSRPILSISRGPTFIPVSEGSEWFKTDSVGVNRIGYRYIPAGIRPQGYATPCRTIESNPTSFRISWEDRSPFLRVTKDGLSVMGSKGFRSARANAPMREGKWYLEVKILHGGGERVGDDNTAREGSHVRLGWGRREASLNGPVGLDGYSYGYRDKTGDKTTLSRPRPYGKPFGTGDVVGMYISLPPKRKPNPKDPHDPAHLKRERIPIDLKGQEVFEILEYPQSKEMSALMDYSGKSATTTSVPSSKKPPNGKLPERTSGPPAPNKKPNAPPPPQLRNLPILPGSKIAFFLNGECQGTAFSDLYDYLPLRQTETQRKAKERHKRTREGVKEHRENPFDDGTLGYYPFISLFNDASIRLNPGPDFEFPPPEDIEKVLEDMANGKPPPPPVRGVKQEPMNVCPPSPKTDAPSQLPKQEDLEPNPSLLSSTEPRPPSTSTSSSSWRPAVERYPEFMAEEWAFDALEEEQAKIEAAKWAAADKLAEEKKAEKEKKKKAQAEARKAKKEQQQQALGLGATGSRAGSAQPNSLSQVGLPASSSSSSSTTPLAAGLGTNLAATSDRSTPVSVESSRRASPQTFHTHHPQPHTHPSSPFYNTFSINNPSNHPSPSPLRQTTTAPPVNNTTAGGRDVAEEEEEEGDEEGDAEGEALPTIPIPHPTAPTTDTDGEAEAEDILLGLHQADDSSRDHSPAPTYTSYGGAGGMQSGYTSEAGDGDEDAYGAEAEADQEVGDQDGYHYVEGRYRQDGHASEVDDDMDVDGS